MTKEVITYAELAKRLNACKLFNKYPELDENWFEQLENGSLYYCTVHDPCNDDVRNESEDDCSDEMQEIYQWYLIDPSDADYLKRNTDELIFYSDVLDEYVWGVTHFGTSWDGVTLEFGKDEE